MYLITTYYFQDININIEIPMQEKIYLLHQRNYNNVWEYTYRYYLNRTIIMCRVIYLLANQPARSGAIRQPTSIIDTSHDISWGLTVSPSTWSSVSFSVRGSSQAKAHPATATELWPEQHNKYNVHSNNYVNNYAYI